MVSNIIILAGGQLHKTPELETLLYTLQKDYIIAADSGLRHAKILGLIPNIIVGDFDSVTSQDLAEYKNIPRQTHPPEKDFLDLELAIDIAKQHNVTKLLLLGATGERADQSLAALLIASRLGQEGIKISIHSGYQDIYPLHTGDVHQISCQTGTVFSLLCINKEEPVILTVTGAKYNLTKSALPFGVGRGVSNVVVNDTTVTIEQGSALLIIEHYPDGYTATNNL